jgi:eukaryotic-like serine/threonine-protein kinase
MPDELQEALAPGYILQRELGRGGMATVYLARDTKHNRQVALKVLHAHLAVSLGPERFRREIGFVATLQHPHILTVLDSGETVNGQLWFTMPFVEGETLRSRMRRERQLPLDDAIRITREVALALDYAHRQGIIHRDIKPENILLTADGQALVADFGIARALSPGLAEPDGIDQPVLTETGLVIGTPQYMSPEQAGGVRALDARTDVYSLGAVLYEMLTGEPPFTGPTAHAVVAQLLSSTAPSVRTVRPSVPEAVDAASRKALAPAPLDRWASAGELARALETAERSARTPVTGAARWRLPLAGSTLLGIGFLIGVGVLFAWRAKTQSSRAAGGDDGGAHRAVRLAVLPFENLGDSSDAYFADGVTDAIREKLTGISGLEVIGSHSSAQYRKTTKTPVEIGQELGVRYLLEGKVRWAKGAGGRSRVRVSPELVDVDNAADRWAAPIDAPLTDVFQVQTDIAGKVAQQLQVALTPAARQTIADQPTANLTAYDAYLRAHAIVVSGNSPVVLRRAADAYTEAITRDSTFPLAWAGLGAVDATRYRNGLATPTLADSAERATARALTLAPELPEAHRARAAYYESIQHDDASALREMHAALDRAPNTPEILSATATVEAALGRWDAAIAHLEHAVRVDPRDAGSWATLGFDETRLRRYPAALVAWNQAVALDPENLANVQGLAMVSLAQGDLAGARAVIHGVPPTVDQASLVAYMASFWDLGWVLDNGQERLLLTLRPDAFDGDRGTWAIVIAQQYSFRGDTLRMRAFADSAQAELRKELAINPDDNTGLVELGLAEAYLGHSTDAIRAGERATARVPITMNSHTGAYFQHQLARIYLMCGQPEKALDELEPLLHVPYYLSPGWLRIDPNFAPLRGNPRFERLIAGPK